MVRTRRTTTIKKPLRKTQEASSLKLLIYVWNEILAELPIGLYKYTNIVPRIQLIILAMAKVKLFFNSKNFFLRT